VWEGDRAGRTLHVRRITINLKTPTRDGESDVHVLTTLPEEVAPANRIAAVLSNHDTAAARGNPWSLLLAT
jgi:hypothetical protein